MRFFRLNCDQQDREKVLQLLAEEGFVFRGLKGSDRIFLSTHEPFPMGNSLTHYFGYIYVQDISSILPVLLLRPPRGSVVLDMCASPGSKTSQLARTVGPEGLIAANEPNASRLATLRANLRRLNLINVITSGYDGLDLGYKGLKFDFILLDVPCSGWGTLNRNPGAARMWTKDRLSPLIFLQKSLLESAARLLSPGGRLVYSTCTTNVDENEEQILWAEKELSLTGSEPGSFLPEPNEFPPLESTGPAMFRVNGSQAGGQDFFMACLTRNSGAVPENDSSRRPLKKPRGEHLAFTEDMRQPESGRLWNFSGNVFYVPDGAWRFLNMGYAAQGTLVGRKKSEKFILSPRMRVFLPEQGAQTGFNTTDLELVRRLVSGQSLGFSSSRNLVGFYWQDLALGWLKVKKNRVFWSDR